MKKPKIAILTIRNSYKFGGIFSYTKKIYRFFQKYFDPTIFYLSFDPKVSANIKSFNFKNQVRHVNFYGMNAVEVGSKWAFWEPGHYVYSLSLWKKVLKNYDYFFLESGTAIAGYPLAKLNKKFVISIAAVYQDDQIKKASKLKGIRKIIDFFAQSKMLKIEKFILKKADYILPISNDTKNRINEILDNKKENLSIWSFPISLKIKQKKISESKNIIAIGRFSDPRKNFDMLIRSFEGICKLLPKSQLYIVGKKPEEMIIEKYKNLNCFNNILFTGILTEEDKNSFLKCSDLMLISSYQEGLSIVGLEAMSYGLPVVATDCGGPSDYIINGKNGYLVNIDDDYNMAKKALKILSSDDLYKKFSDFALTFIKDNYSQGRFESIIKYGLIKVYPELKGLFETMDNKIKLTSAKKFEEINL